MRRFSRRGWSVRCDCIREFVFLGSRLSMRFAAGSVQEALSGVLPWESEGRRVLSPHRQSEACELALERHVPETIDALALGMRALECRSSAFRSYCFRFDDELALFVL